MYSLQFSLNFKILVSDASLIIKIIITLLSYFFIILILLTSSSVVLYSERSLWWKWIITTFDKINELTITSSFKRPCPSIITKFLFTSKFFSKNTSTYPEENRFLSCCSKGSWVKLDSGNNKSFKSCDLPVGWIHLFPKEKLNIPKPSSILKTISGT